MTTEQAPCTSPFASATHVDGYLVSFSSWGLMGEDRTRANVLVGIDIIIGVVRGKGHQWGIRWRLTLPPIRPCLMHQWAARLC